MKYILGAFALYVIVGGAWIAWEIKNAEEYEDE